MDATSGRGPLAGTLGIAMLLAGLSSLGWLGAYAVGWALPFENGAMENVQAGMLFGAALVLLLAAHRAAGPQRLLLLGFAWFCVTFLLRELSVESLGLPAVLTWLGTGLPRNVWLGAGWVAIGLGMLGQRRAVWDIYVTWLRTPAGLLLLAAGACYVASWPMDKNFFGLDVERACLLEELGELNGALLLLGSALATVRALIDETRPVATMPRPHFQQRTARATGKSPAAVRDA